MKLSGEVVELRSKNYKAVLVSVGAAVAALQYKGKDIVMPHDPDQVAPSHMGKTLIPWPNRITDGTYNWAGTDYKLWINEFVTPAASHGLCAYEYWDVVEQSVQSVTFSHIISARVGYPCTLQCRVTYTLDDGDGTKGSGGLKVYMQVTNLSSIDAPVAIGSHPYLTCNQAVNDEYMLKVSAKVLRQDFDKKFNLLGESADPLIDKCVQGGALIGDAKIDNCFRVDAAEGTAWTCEISAHNLTVGVKSNTPYLQFFTAEKMHRKCFAIEPMTSNVNAFNIADKASLAVKPNTTREMSFTIYGFED